LEFFEGLDHNPCEKVLTTSRTGTTRITVLKITDIRTATVVGNYYWTFVRVYSGKENGLGEGFFAPQLEQTIKDFGRVILGEDALDPAKVYDKMKWASVPSGMSGANYHAISAIEIAILDLVGKHLNIPVSTLLGGKYREKIKVYVDAHAGESLEALDPTLLPITPRWMQELGAKPQEEVGAPLHGRAAEQVFSEEYTPEAYASRARQMKQEGYTAIKFDLDVPTPFTRDFNRAAGILTRREVLYLAGLVAAVREAVGDDLDIMFDLHWRFNVESSIQLARAIEPYGVTWLEDPVPPSDPEILDLVAKATKTPIATGENLYTRYGFAGVVRSSVSVVTPDALKAGGLVETKFIAELAAMHEKMTSPHNIGSPVGTLAQAHLAAVVANFGVLEFHGHDVPIWYKLAKKPIIRDGFIEIKDEPGLGVELDEAVAAKYALGERINL